MRQKRRKEKGKTRGKIILGPYLPMKWEFRRSSCCREYTNISFSFVRFLFSFRSSPRPTLCYYYYYYYSFLLVLCQQLLLISQRRRTKKGNDGVRSFFSCFFPFNQKTINQHLKHRNDQAQNQKMKKEDTCRTQPTQLKKEKIYKKKPRTQELLKW